MILLSKHDMDEYNAIVIQKYIFMKSRRNFLSGLYREGCFPSGLEATLEFIATNAREVYCACNKNEEKQLSLSFYDTISSLRTGWYKNPSETGSTIQRLKRFQINVFRFLALGMHIITSTISIVCVIKSTISIINRAWKYFKLQLNLYTIIRNF